MLSSSSYWRIIGRFLRVYFPTLLIVEPASGTYATGDVINPDSTGLPCVIAQETGACILIKRLLIEELATSGLTAPKIRVYFLDTEPTEAANDPFDIQTNQNILGWIDVDDTAWDSITSTRNGKQWDGEMPISLAETSNTVYLVIVARESVVIDATHSFRVQVFGEGA
jgi:hypothetical protein